MINHVSIAGSIINTDGATAGAHGGSESRPDNANIMPSAVTQIQTSAPADQADRSQPLKAESAGFAFDDDDLAMFEANLGDEA